MRRVARLILANGGPASGKFTLARRYVDDHDQAVLVEVDTLWMALRNWSKTEQRGSRALELAAIAVVEHLGAGRDVVMPTTSAGSATSSCWKPWRANTARRWSAWFLRSTGPSRSTGSALAAGP